MKRRTMMKAGAGLALAPWLTACGGGSDAGTAGTAARNGQSYAHTPQSLRTLVQKMVDFGPRLTGSAAHNRFVDFLEDEFRSLGLQTRRDPYEVTLWEVGDYALTVDGPAGHEEIPVDAYYPRSAPTTGEGLSAPLVCLGAPLQHLTLDVTQLESQAALLESLAAQLPGALQGLIGALSGGVKGAIAVVELPFAPLVLGAFYPFLTYLRDDDLTISPLTDYKRAWISGLFLMEPVVEALVGAGAAGVIFVFDSSPACTRGQYLPFLGDAIEIPGFIVNRETGNLLRSLAGRQATMTLSASIRENVRTDTLVAILPGMSEENILINTHTDGQNACEENGAVACLEVARHYASLPLAERPRTLVFTLVTGHMAPHMPQAGGIISHFPELVAQTVASLTLEHLGAREWLDDASGYHDSGRPEPGVVFHSQTAIVSPVIQAARTARVDRLLVLRPLLVAFFGVGLPYHLAGIPSVAYIAGPNYLVAIEPDGGMSRFDEQRMSDELDMMMHMLDLIAVMPAQQLGLGDSSLLAVAAPVSGQVNPF